MSAKFREFVNPARERNQLWRVFCTLTLVIAVEIGAMFAFAHFDLIPGGVSGRIPDTPLGVIFMLLTFIPKSRLWMRRSGYFTGAGFSLFSENSRRGDLASVCSSRPVSPHFPLLWSQLSQARRPAARSRFTPGPLMR